MKYLIAVVVTIAVAVSCAACGSSPASPSAPTIAQVGGVWTGSVTQTSVSGGECIGTTLAASNGSADHYTVTIAQAGTALTGTATSQTSGQTCNYAGTAGTNTITFNVTSCPTVGFRLTCSNGVQRDMYLNSRNLTASLNGSALVGTVGESWNVYVAGATVNPLAGMNITYNVGFTH